MADTWTKAAENQEQQEIQKLVKFAFSAKKKEKKNNKCAKYHFRTRILIM